MSLTVQRKRDLPKAELSEGDIPNLVGQIFSEHSSYQSLTPELTKRWTERYLDLFDPDKKYFLQGDVETCQADADFKMTQRLFWNNYSDFGRLNRTVWGVVQRARNIRNEIGVESLRKSLLSTPFTIEEKSTCRVPSLHFDDYAVTQEELVNRQSNLMSSKLFWSTSDSFLRLDAETLQSLRNKVQDDEEEKYGFLQQEGIFRALDVLRSFAQSLDPHTHVHSFRILSQRNIRPTKTSFHPLQSGGIGVIALHSFYQTDDGKNSAIDLCEAIDSFQMTDNLLGLVLDLRENSGGSLEQAVQVSGLFLGDKIIGFGKKKLEEVQAYSVEGPAIYQGPLIILTSKKSASASELISKAVQDHGVGIIVGDQSTFGKGSIQTRHEESAPFRVTTGMWYGPFGDSIQQCGVKVDIEVPTDYCFQKIGESHCKYSLTPEPFEVVDLSSMKKVDSIWKRILPKLRLNSEKRIAENLEFKQQLEKQYQNREVYTYFSPDYLKKMNDDNTDLALEETLKISEDMVEMRKQLLLKGILKK